MNVDVVIVGAGPAGIFTALEMLRKGSAKKITMVEKGREGEPGHHLAEKHSGNGKSSHPRGGHRRRRSAAGAGARPQTAGDGLPAGLDHRDPVRGSCVVKCDGSILFCPFFCKISEKEIKFSE